MSRLKFLSALAAFAALTLAHSAPVAADPLNLLPFTPDLFGSPREADPLRLSPFPPGAAGPPVSLLSMRCQDAIRLVEAAGSVALTDEQGITRRYVPVASRCHMASPRDAWVRTRDIAACSVGYTCEGMLSAF